MLVGEHAAPDAVRRELAPALEVGVVRACEHLCDELDCRLELALLEMAQDLLAEPTLGMHEAAERTVDAAIVPDSARQQLT